MASERQHIEDELNSIKVDIRSVKTGSGGTLSTAASTVYGVGSGAFAQPLAFSRWQSERSLRQFEFREWMRDWS